MSTTRGITTVPHSSARRTGVPARLLTRAPSLFFSIAASSGLIVRVWHLPPIYECCRGHTRSSAGSTGAAGCVRVLTCASLFFIAASCGHVVRLWYLQRTQHTVTTRAFRVCRCISCPFSTPWIRTEPSSKPTARAVDRAAPARRVCVCARAPLQLRVSARTFFHMPTAFDARSSLRSVYLVSTQSHSIPQGE